MRRILPIDLGFAEDHDFSEAVVLALIRKNELEGYPERLSTSGGLRRMYPQIFKIEKYRDVLDRLEKEGYLTEHKRYFRGKYPLRIYKLTDKAIREYVFGEEFF
jgi:hypothetical protein